jgi:hypothetical protein
MMECLIARGWLTALGKRVSNPAAKNANDFSVRFCRPRLGLRVPLIPKRGVLTALRAILLLSTVYCMVFLKILRAKKPMGSSSRCMFGGSFANAGRHPQSLALVLKRLLRD